MIRAIETKQLIKRNNPKIETKDAKRIKLAQINKRLLEIRESKKPGKERINLLIDEVINLLSIV